MRPCRPRSSSRVRVVSESYPASRWTVMSSGRGGQGPRRRPVHPVQQRRRRDRPDDRFRHDPDGRQQCRFGDRPLHRRPGRLHHHPAPAVQHHHLHGRRQREQRAVPGRHRPPPSRRHAVPAVLPRGRLPADVRLQAGRRIHQHLHGGQPAQRQVPGRLRRLHRRRRRRHPVDLQRHHQPPSAPSPRLAPARTTSSSPSTAASASTSPASPPSREH